MQTNTELVLGPSNVETRRILRRSKPAMHKLIELVTLKIDLNKYCLSQMFGYRVSGCFQGS